MPLRIHVLGTEDGAYFVALFLAPQLGYHHEPGEPQIETDLSFPNREASEQRRALMQGNFAALDAWLSTVHFTWEEFTQLPPLSVFTRSFVETELPGDAKSRNFLDRMAEVFTSTNFVVKRNELLDRVRFDIHAQKKGRSLGFVPYVDHFFTYGDEGAPDGSLERLLRVHRSALALVDRLHPSRWLRWTVPTTITVAVSVGGFPRATTDYVRTRSLSRMGAPNLLVLVDLEQKEVIASRDPTSLPITRARQTIGSLCDSIFRTQNGA